MGNNSEPVPKQQLGCTSNPEENSAKKDVIQGHKWPPSLAQFPAPSKILFTHGNKLFLSRGRYGGNWKNWVPQLLPHS